MEGLQDFVVARQAAEDLQQRRRCSSCGAPHTSKGGGAMIVKTVFGAVTVANPRWHRCPCQRTGPKTFRPAAAWLVGQTSPELLYLATKWASVIPFAKVADLLREVLPVDAATNHETIRDHLQATAQRMEDELGEERPRHVVEDELDDCAPQAPPDGPITVGIDGGYVRAAHKAGFFEVIAGRSVVAFRRAAEQDVAEAKCFGYVQTYDQKPRRRLWQLLKSQGLQDHQQVVFMSDGGEDVRQVQAYLHPGSEHWIDWFHITMRLTVLQQQTKSLQHEADRADIGAEIAAHLESVKHLLWHGNVVEALERQVALMFDLDLIRHHSAAAEKLAIGLNDFHTYIRNNQTFIPNFGERYRHGETISTAFVESTINQVVSRRFVKKQQMTWTLRGAHLLLQTRTAVLNDELEDV
ncbi:MAG: ISKra4 family transposase, partial [Acidobacteriota bacterium]